MTHPLSRRSFLGAGATLLAGAALRADELPAKSAEKIAFFHIGDTHYLAQKESPDKIDEESHEVTTRLIDTLNKLPGSMIPDAAGAGNVATPRAVIHAGDLIDTGDKTGQVHEKMQRTEWAAYQENFGLTGKDGRLKFPIYEVHGNHDSPPGKGLVIDGIIERNKKRPGVTAVSDNGLHYAFDLGHVRFYNLGITVGQVKEVTQRRRYNPADSFAFLESDLKKTIGDTRRPIVITHHIDVARYGIDCKPDDPANLQREWHPCDVAAYHALIARHNTAAILYGHTHARSVFKWDGRSTKAPAGIPVFNVDNSSHFHSQTQSVFYFEMTDKEVTAREYATKNRWQTAAWTPQVWRHAIG